MPDTLPLWIKPPLPMGVSSSKIQLLITKVRFADYGLHSCMHNQLTRDLFRTYAQSGMNYNLIAKKLDIGRGTVFAWRKQMNLPPRVRGAGSPCRGKKAQMKFTGGSGGPNG
jgi:hypothetical protein